MSLWISSCDTTASYHPEWSDSRDTCQVENQGACIKAAVAISAVIAGLAGIAQLVDFFATAEVDSDDPPPSQVTDRPPPREESTTETQPTKKTRNPPSETKYLVDVTPLTDEYGATKGSADVRDRTLPQSISMRVDKYSLPVNQVEYNLGSRWKQFDATIGVHNDSPTGGRLTFEVSADGSSLFRKELAKGQLRELHVKIEDTQTLKLKVTFTAGEYYNDYSFGVWGDARLIG
ncbi:NPCBM/NEW2 domain-containing protein [Streptomyces sp. NPDC058637]|uniref:NPCBM/NEW2 domain-containing protein n=1 Tax=Streptomyces sp. NPDC058637 TaxID=3346569 RepID=UPI0036619C94